MNLKNRNDWLHRKRSFLHWSYLGFLTFSGGIQMEHWAKMSHGFSLKIVYWNNWNDFRASSILLTCVDLLVFAQFFYYVDWSETYNFSAKSCFRFNRFFRFSISITTCIVSVISIPKLRFLKTLIFPRALKMLQNWVNFSIFTF